MFILNLFFHYQNRKNSIGVDLPLWGVLYSWPLHETSVAVKISAEEEAMVRGIHLCERRVESGERRAVVGERKIGYSVVIFLEKEPLKPWKSGRLGSKFSLKLTKKTPKPWNIPSKIVK